MASVESLGLHQPTGLQQAIQEGLLPPNPPPESYTWECSCGHAEASCARYSASVLKTRP